MSEIERAYVRAQQQLHMQALEAANLKIQVIRAYMADHWPHVRFEARTLKSDMLTVDLCFPGSGIRLSRALASELGVYLERLLEVGDEI